ncbi:diadenylate cyclase [Natrinema sp. 1APR25-10V2]|uniref:diadenylate cyclase n=1 Tax=Natrinema sp. 1APR25-10V2 TaxID=2951081 RepID=UPI00287440C9|nr:diadenylate cyclase [Natrinema sp. 1APR25-10V2]MDS0477884.1 diadenylate cyclase [Natrinema sp. 1APR25-10V2]
MDDSELRIAYESHDGVRELIDCVRYTLEGISLDFDRWGDRYVKGPGMYVAVVTGPTVAEFADPMGHNRWPTDRCRAVRLDLETFFETAQEVAMTRDGAIVVSVDGVVQEQMVRFRDLVPGDLEDADGGRAEYEDWMGSRHMSALDTSQRANVIATVTLSEETGRVTIFERGSFDTHERAELGGEWNVDGYV